MLFVFGHFLFTSLRKSLITSCQGLPLSGVCEYPIALIQTWRIRLDLRRVLAHHSFASFLGAYKPQINPGMKPRGAGKKIIMVA